MYFGYWRKANHIHKWFVDKSDKSLASKLLPTTQGFFFGSDEYDEYYFNKTKETIDIINKALKLPDCVFIYYESSW